MSFEPTLFETNRDYRAALAEDPNGADSIPGPAEERPCGAPPPTGLTRTSRGWIGAHFDGEGVRFRLFSENATAIELCLFERADSAHASRTLHLDRGPEGLWETYLEGAEPGLLYGYRAHGPWRPHRGHRFNPSKLLVDPRALALTGEPRPHPSLFAHQPGEHPELSYNSADSAGAMPKCVVVDPSFDWQGVDRPRIPWSETVLYEAHVRGITRLHPEVPEELRGTYLGLAHPAVIDHLRRLGITTLELMPLHQGAPEEHLLHQQRRNYWGYNPIAFFAPTAAYASETLGQQVRELQTLVRELHRAGIEVVVDMVYNHTAEGGRTGPQYGPKGLDNSVYYRSPANRPGRYVDFTGCGNTLDTRRPQVVDLIVDSARYWVEVLGVDGFRLDLALTLGRGSDAFDPAGPFFRAVAEDPVLRRAKWIAEPWDLGLGGYGLGRFPAEWAEWNDRFRDTTRRFWRGEASGPLTSELATRLSGSQDAFSDKGPLRSINYVISHDGFTLADLVSYGHKHNEANGEDNRDGTNNNLSRNWGVEGPSQDFWILARRDRARRNMMATLLLAQGVPLLQHGDEFGRSQGGNNNPYCQDNAITWTDWSRFESGGDGDRFFQFVRGLIAIRRRFPHLRRSTFLEGGNTGDGGDARERQGDVIWLGAHGERLDPEDWSREHHRAFAMVMLPVAEAKTAPETAASGQRTTDEASARATTLILMVNGSEESIRFRWPRQEGSRPPALLVDTAEGIADPNPAVLGASADSSGDDSHRVAPGSMSLVAVPPAELT